MASGDVEGAFDGIRHEDVTQALLQKGVHPGAVCSLLRESFDPQGRISLPGAPVSICSWHAPGEGGRAWFVEPGAGQCSSGTCGSLGS